LARCTLWSDRRGSSGLSTPFIRRRIDVDVDTGPDGMDRFGLLLQPHQIDIVESE
jgi:hypothetical protein